MKSAIAIALAAVFLVSCGVDGAPLKPTYTTETTIGYNSVTGPFSHTIIGVQFGP